MQNSQRTRSNLFDNFYDEKQLKINSLDRIFIYFYKIQARMNLINFCIIFMVKILSCIIKYGIPYSKKFQ